MAVITEPMPRVNIHRYHASTSQLITIITDSNTYVSKPDIFQVVSTVSQQRQDSDPDCTTGAGAGLKEPPPLAVIALWISGSLRRERL